MLSFVLLFATNDLDHALSGESRFTATAGTAGPKPCPDENQQSPQTA
jgi:hypothetical protein